MLTIVWPKHTFLKRACLKKESPAGRLSGAWGYQYCLFILTMVWISIFIKISTWILISPHPPPPRAEAVRRRGRGGGMGWVHIIMNMNIEDYIIWYLLSFFCSLLVILYYLFPITSCLSQAEAGTWLNNCGFLYDLWAFRPFRTVRNDPSRQACK